MAEEGQDEYEKDGFIVDDIDEEEEEQDDEEDRADSDEERQKKKKRKKKYYLLSLFGISTAFFVDLFPIIRKSSTEIEELCLYISF